jgi:hypothetical protein
LQGNTKGENSDGDHEGFPSTDPIRHRRSKQSAEEGSRAEYRDDLGLLRGSQDGMARLRVRISRGGEVIEPPFHL